MTSPFYTSDNRSRRGRATGKVDTSRFYGQFHGHPINDLERLLPALRESSNSLIWTAGDSSLDNKYWFQDYKSALGVYRDVLDPPTMNADVTYWLNRLAIDRETASQPIGADNQRRPIATINTAVEATTVQNRNRTLLAQDAFLRDNIQPGDTLIVSIGGNDVANAPTPCTIFSMLSLVKMPRSCLDASCIGFTPPCDEHCYGCGPVAMTSCCCAFPPCLGYMNHLFGTRIQRYIERLTSKTKPKRVLVCMIYYLDETPTPSWAGLALKCLGYDSNPEKLQYLIRKMYVDATSKISISGTTVIPVPLFDALDGKTSDDYVARVEPSSQGGRKMAEYLLSIIERDEQQQLLRQNSPGSYQAMKTTHGSGPVESSYMLDRS